MKLFVKERPDIRETEVHILCEKRDQEVENMINSIQSVQHTLLGKKENGDTIPFVMNEVLYFEAVEKKVFAYLQNEIYEMGYKLYEIEMICDQRCFLRISKSVVVNLCYIQKIQTEEGRRLKLLLKNGEWLMVSRMYVNDLKIRLGMKGEK